STHTYVNVSAHMVYTVAPQPSPAYTLILRADHKVFTYLIFFFNDTATTEIYTLSLHDALPISHRRYQDCLNGVQAVLSLVEDDGDRKSTRLNSSHLGISYAVFCLKKKKNENSRE